MDHEQRPGSIDSERAGAGSAAGTEAATAPWAPLLLEPADRARLWDTLRHIVETYVEKVPGEKVAPPLDVATVRTAAESFTFTAGREPAGLLREVAALLAQNQVHTPHPRYFGLFNPAPSTMSLFADALVAALNPQLAGWSHSPLAVEMEAHLVRSMGEKFGFEREKADGVFTTGGAEANQTALLCALTNRWPNIQADGLQAISDRPVLYLSREGHHTFAKAARTSGLGVGAVRRAKVGPDLRVDPDALRGLIRDDRASGLCPLMVVATAGSTGAGAIDPLRELGAVARDEGLWFHVDAAWGGAAALLPELKPALAGIEQADSITFDSHKWLSISMGAGLYLTRRPGSLDRTFALTASYMPREGEHLAVRDPYARSIQWSRRFIGLKLFLTLAVAGWPGYERVLRHQVAMGRLLRARLAESGWTIVNDTPLPLVCFTHERLRDAGGHQDLANRVVGSGRAWISTVQVGEDARAALRACVTNYRTTEDDIVQLVKDLDSEIIEAAAP